MSSTGTASCSRRGIPPSPASIATAGPGSCPPSYAGAMIDRMVELRLTTRERWSMMSPPRTTTPQPLQDGDDPMRTGPAPRTLISLATYNEAGNLRPLVETIERYAPDAEVLVIDDNSPD